MCVCVYKCMKLYIKLPIYTNIHLYLYNYKEIMCTSLS